MACSFKFKEDTFGTEKRLKCAETENQSVKQNVTNVVL